MAKRDIVGLCEKKLCDLIGRKHCILTGRGATALWIAYSLTDPKRHKILLPAMVCLSPMFTVHYANREPIFSDVRIEDATIDPDHVRRLLVQHPDVGAVLAVHLYGYPAMMEELSEICKWRGVMLIEDLAPALGGKDGNGNYFGSVGDISVVSFGHAKILDVGGGGALLTDDDALAEKAMDLAEGLKLAPLENAVLAGCYEKLYYTLFECAQHQPSFLELFDHFPELFKSLYMFRIDIDQAGVIHHALDTLQKEILERKQIADEYYHNLHGLQGVTFFSPLGPGVPWRFTFRVEKTRRDSLLKRVRSAGFDISSWYPAITEWTPTGRLQGKASFPVANILEREVVNLWVTRDYGNGKAKLLSKLIKEILLEEVLCNSLYPY